MKQLNILYRKSDSSYTWQFVERGLVNKAQEEMIDKGKKRFENIPLAKKDFEEKHPKVTPKIVVKIEPENIISKVKSAVKKITKSKKQQNEHTF